MLSWFNLSGHLVAQGVSPQVARIAAISALLMGSMHGSAWAGDLYRCELVNGSEVTSRNHAKDYPDAFKSCQVVATTAVPQILAGKEPRQFLAAPMGDPLLAEPNLPRQAPSFVALPGAVPRGLQEHDELIVTVSRRHGMDPDLVRAVVHVESAGRAQAVSSAGAIGLMQIIPATGARYGVTNARDLYQPAINVDAGTRYLRDLLTLFKGRLDLAVAAYNAGEGAVIRYGLKTPPYTETQNYVKRVLASYQQRVRARSS